MNVFFLSVEIRHFLEQRPFPSFAISVFTSFLYLLCHGLGHEHLSQSQDSIAWVRRQGASCQWPQAGQQFRHGTKPQQLNVRNQLVGPLSAVSIRRVQTGQKRIPVDR